MSEPTAATRIDNPAREGSGRSLHEGSVSATLTPEEAAYRDELRRVRLFTMFLALMCVVGAAVIALIDGDHVAKTVHLIGVLTTGLVAALYAALVTPERFKPIYLVVLVGVASLTNLTGYYFWGYLSGYIAIVTVSAYLVAGAGGKPVIATGTVISIGGHIAIAALTTAGIIEERAVLPASHTPVFDRIATVGLLNIVVIGAVVLGAQTHAVAKRALAAQLEAFRDLARREAQLAEAREEARDVMAAGGRMSGQQLGRFAIGELIGRGAMGEVYAATDDTGTPCALKLLAPHLRDNADALERFHREARAAAALASPHIVRIIEVSPPEATLPYFAMERLEGVDLATAIKDQPIRPLAEVVDIVTQIAAGLDVAHAAGVIHRDLKLANIFGCGNATRTWKLLDFGVAKLVDAGATLTQHQQVVGTPTYMAPEQARGAAVDARTDVYALGVVTYRLLTGMPVVVPGDIPGMLYEVVHKMPPRPGSLVELSTAVEAVLAIALAKSADHRFGSAGELARALAEAAAGRQDPEIELRARTVLARMPWGHWARRRATTVGL